MVAQPLELVDAAQMRLGGFVMKLRHIAVVWGFVLGALSLSGCGSYLTAQEIDTFGTRTFSVPKEELVGNVAAVLESMGYEVVVADVEKGLVKTARKEIGQTTRTSTISSGRDSKITKNYTSRSGSSSSRSSTTTYSRQYTVKITESKNGALAVRVTPKVFIGERDVSQEEVWNVDGTGGEIELWASFFSELESIN